MNKIYDLIILGAGPAGTAAGVYAARKRLKTLLITEEIGGQSIVSETIYNWIGTPEISGHDLAENFKKHLEYYEDGEILSIQTGYKVISLEKTEDGFFTLVDASGKQYRSKTIIVATGSQRRKLPVTGADRLEHKGLTYCATCDGPLFAGMDVVVVGGGNAGFESAAQLSAYAKSVTILQRGENYRADALTVDKVLAKDNVRGITGVDILEVTGDNFVDGIVYRDRKSGEEHKLETKGIFVEIGQIPNSTIVKDLVELTETKHIKIDPFTQKTSQEGIWAAGDVTYIKYHQNNIAAGDGVKALEDVYNYLHAS